MKMSCKTFPYFRGFAVVILLLTLSVSVLAQSDYYIRQAESYMRDAEYYNKRAASYERDAEYYNKQAQSYLRDADY